MWIVGPVGEDAPIKLGLLRRELIQFVCNLKILMISQQIPYAQVEREASACAGVNLCPGSWLLLVRLYRELSRRRCLLRNRANSRDGHRQIRGQQTQASGRRL